MVLKRIKKNLFFAVKGIVLTTALFLSMIIFLNSYELFFNQDLDYAWAITTTQAKSHFSASDNSFKVEKEPNLSGDPIGNYGRITNLIVPGIGKRLEILPGLENNKGWLSRSNKAQYFISRSNDKEELKYIVFYLNKSWRTIDAPELIAAGDNLFIDTDRTLPLGVSLIVSETKNTGVVLLIEDPKTQKSYYARGEFLTILNIRQ